MLKFLTRNSRHPLVKTERVKLMAGGVQLIAIGTLVGSSIAPIFNANLSIAIGYRAAAAGGAVILEFLALWILSYLPTPDTKGG